jgi:hypothetical protein
MLPNLIVKKLCLPATLFLTAVCPFVPASVSTYGQSAAAKPAAVLNIQVDKSLHSVSPTLYGMMTEEINFSYDGGLYPEMVSNRVMRDRNWNQQDWLVVQNASAGAKMEKDKTTGPSEALNDSIKLTISAATPEEPAGVRNMGFWGYPLRPDVAYKGSLYAKADAAGLGPLHWNLVSNKTGTSVASAEVPSIGAGIDAHQAGYGLDDAGLIVSADVSQSSQWQPGRSDGDAGRPASCVFAIPWRQLSRGRPHQRALRMEEDDWAARGPADAPEPVELSLFGWPWTA